MLGVFKRKWKPKRASSSNGHHHNNNQNGRLLETAAASADGRTAPSARQIHPVYGEKAQLLAYENEQDALLHHHGHHLHHAVASAKAAEPPPPPPAPPYLSIPPPPPPPAYPLAPNICVEGGRIEFIRPPLDGAPSDDKERVASTPAPASHLHHHQGAPAPAILPHDGHRRAGSIASSGGTVSRAQQTLPLEDDIPDSHSEEKCDLAKESLEARVAGLEALLEAERRGCARERSAVQRLQRQLAKREALRRDVDRERCLRLDSAAEAEQCKARLGALQRDLARMEEALRCMLQYKSRCSQLKQDKAALAASYEARIQQCQATIGKLSQENEALKKQVKTLDAQQQGGGAVQQALLERLRSLESDNRLLSSDAELQRRQYERCLDDVANQVVRALLSQKGLREEIGALQQRIRELETQNRALTTLLVQQIQHGEQDTKLSPPGDVATSEQGCNDMVTLSKPWLRRPAGRYRPSPSCGPQPDEHALLAAVASIDPALWLQVARPQSLHLAPSLEGAQESVAGREARSARAAEAECSATDLCGWHPIATAAAESLRSTCEAVAAEDADVLAEAVPDDGSSSPESSPESGNRDEGYSTMSSDVQVEASSRITETSTTTTSMPPLGHSELEDVKEEAELVVGPETVAETKATAPATSGTRMFMLDLQALSARHSFPPARDLQAVLRGSLSDSHLCLTRLLRHAAASLASTPASCPAAAPTACSAQHPLRRARATSSLGPTQVPLQQVLEGVEVEEDAELGADWWDADYVQHWLRLDETRSAMQQRHREALDLELEYDQAELEDWSLSLSCEDLDSPWIRRVSDQPPAPSSDAGLPAGPVPQLPSIQETNSLELEEDSSECLWNNASYLETGLVGVVNGGILGAAPATAATVAGWPYALFDNAVGSLQAGTDAMMSSLAVNAAGSSPGGSWSSSAAASDCFDCCLNGCHGEEGSSKRSSAALSGCSDESAGTSGAASGASRDRESPTAIGTDFTRDFYRLVKFESTKSLASNSSSRHSRGGAPNINNNLPASMDREQALQSVLKFIAEQQKYCHSREEQDSELGGSRPVSLCDDRDERPDPAGSLEPREDENEQQQHTRLDDSALEEQQEAEEGESADRHLVRPCEERTQQSNQECTSSDMVVTSLVDDATPATPSIVPLETVLEDEELDTSPRERRPAIRSEVFETPSTTTTPSVPSVLVCDEDDKAVSFHENATSKDVIDELNRMIRKGDGDAVEGDAVTPDCRSSRSRTTTVVGTTAMTASTSSTASVDGTALCCPTGWVHVERDIDFTDPKARANLLDVMLASSASSGSMSSSGSDSGEDLPDGYRHLHRLHRFRRHKKASAFREALGVLRLPSSGARPSILGRDDFFVRYGEKEREAISSFDFLDDMSTASISCTSGASSTLGSLQKLDSVVTSPTAADDDARAATPTPQYAVDTTEDSDEHTGGQLSLSDSCGHSRSASRSSLEGEQLPSLSTVM